jgi:hypothetical protein
LRIIIYPQQFTTRNDVGQSKKVNELDVFFVENQLKENANKVAISILFSPSLSPCFLRSLFFLSLALYVWFV